MGRSALIALIVGMGLGVSACQPLYGGKPEKLATPQKKRPPKEEAVAEVKVPEIEDCTADFRGEPKTVRAQVSVSNQLTGEGDSALSKAGSQKDPAAQAGLIKDSIDKYRNALIKDPYNAEATLKLAIAYDQVYRKGCAIAMLKRLASLSANPTYGRGASPHNATSQIDAIGDNGQWFKRYRKDAMTAVGR